MTCSSPGHAETRLFQKFPGYCTLLSDHAAMNTEFESVAQTPKTIGPFDQRIVLCEYICALYGTVPPCYAVGRDLQPATYLLSSRFEAVYFSGCITLTLRIAVLGM